MTVIPSAQAQSFGEFMKQKDAEFRGFIDTKQKEFDEFRRQKNEEFARFMEQGNWKVYQQQEILKKTVEKELRPVIYKDDGQKKEHKQQYSEIVPFKQTVPQIQPKPIVPIKPNDDKQSYGSFTFYGTRMKARWGDLDIFKLEGTNEKALANSFRKLTDARYNNLLSDCLSLRDNYSLCDWAYYQMLDSLASAICGKGSNEAMFLKGVLYQQSGYTMRFALEPTSKRLHLLVKIDGIAYDTPQFAIDGKTFHLFGKAREQLTVCPMAYSEEQDMSMSVSSLPRFEFNLSSMKRIKSKSYRFVVETAVNINQVHFMQDYPTTYDGKDMMTRWAYYANTPVSEEVRQFIYPQLKELLKNTNDLMAVNMLLDWVQQPSDEEIKTTRGTQTGFPYMNDDMVWGHDRAFFAEETFYYPGSDCEDHAILFSHLVRDLLGLDVVLVYYPKHLATAVCFNSNVEGDYIMVGNRKFVVADPTFSGAPVGETMPSCVGKGTKVILCKR